MVKKITLLARIFVYNEPCKQCIPFQDFAKILQGGLFYWQDHEWQVFSFRCMVVGFLERVHLLAKIWARIAYFLNQGVLHRQVNEQKSGSRQFVPIHEEAA